MFSLFDLNFLLMPAFLGLDLNYTLRNVMMGSAILGAVGGAIGCFAVLRRESLMGDTLAHAALPGICLAFLVTGSRTSLVLMLGAAITGWLGTLCVLAIVRGSRVKQDAALGIVLSVFFGIGTVLLTHISRTGGANQSGLDRFLFGQAASIVRDDVVTMAVLGAVALGVLVLLFKEFKLLCFDPALAFSLGLPTTGLTIVLTGLIVVAVVIGLQAVGVILMVAVLIAPALAARQWTNRLEVMVVLAAIFGAVSGVVGSVLSAEIPRLPTGPTIVLAATVIVVISMLFSPERGIVWGAIRNRRQQRQYGAARVLASLLGVQGSGGVTVSQLASVTGRPERFLNRHLRTLSQRNMTRYDAGPGRWTLTDTGLVAADEAKRREDLWKLYLANQMDISTDGVHLGMDDIERLLPPDVLRAFDKVLLQADAVDKPVAGVATPAGSRG